MFQLKLLQVWCLQSERVDKYLKTKLHHFNLFLFSIEVHRVNCQVGVCYAFSLTSVKTKKKISSLKFSANRPCLHKSKTFFYKRSTCYLFNGLLFIYVFIYVTLNLQFVLYFCFHFKSNQFLKIHSGILLDYLLWQQTCGSFCCFIKIIINSKLVQ